jgi:hypothetical protein
VVDREGSFHNYLLARSFADFLIGSSLRDSSVAPSWRVVVSGFSSTAGYHLGPSEQGSIVSDDNSSVISDSDMSDGSSGLSHSLSWRQLVATEYCASCRREHSPARPLQLCSGCFWVGYCGLECQRLNWLSHRIICSHLRSISNDSDS